MKVLILITKSNWGGAQRYVYDLAKNLPKDDYDVEIMAGGNGFLIDRLLEIGIKANGDLPINRDVSILKDMMAFFRLIKMIKEKKPDILHLNSSKIGVLGAFAGRLTKVPKIIFTSHGWAFNENRTLFSRIIIRFLYWITIILSHNTITVSDALQEQFINWPWISDKMTTVHNGIKPEPAFSKANARSELAKTNARLMNILNSTKNPIFIGSIGEIHHIKGYEYALRGIKQLKTKVFYLIIGEGENRQNLEKDIENLNLGDSVILLGRIPDAFQYIKAFDIFLISSISEGLPYVLLEAGLASLPVVSTAVGGIPEIIEDMKSGILIQSKKPREIGNAIEFYLNHKKTMKEQGLALNEKISKEFSIEKMINETMRVYRV